MRHIYVHVPFCRRRCTYCDFSIAVRKEIPGARFVDAIAREVDLRDAPAPAPAPARAPVAGTAPVTGTVLPAADTPLETVYLGGGTPSLLEPAELERLLRLISGRFGPLPSAREVTLEANPDDVTAERARSWLEAGVTRVSLGVQSFDDRVLEWMHRTHSSEANERAVQELRRAGVESISLDLVFALPGELERDWAADLDRVLALEPEHVSVYGLTVEGGTPLSKWLQAGRTRIAPDTRYESEFLEAHETLERAGFSHYEVSNYARAGRESLHNSIYWSATPYLGLGPSAHSFDGVARWWNTREWAAYSKLVESNMPPVAGREELTPEQVRIERFYLGLRTAGGVRMDELTPNARARLGELEGKGFAVTDPDGVWLTAAGWLRLDELAVLLTT